jgi:hypothetical protein
MVLDPNACGELTATDVEILHRHIDSAKQESPRLKPGECQLENCARCLQYLQKLIKQPSS